MSTPEELLFNDLDSLVPLTPEDAFFPLDVEDKSIPLLDFDDLLGFEHGASPVSDTMRVGVSAEATPATSESWNERNCQGNNTSSKRSCGTSLPSELEYSEEEKRQARMRKNRENAHLSRLRKKQQLESLQQTCENLAQQNTELNVFVQRLAAENFLLRDHLNEVCRRAKVDVPDVPSVMEDLKRPDGLEDGDWAGTGEKEASGSGRPARSAATKRKRGGASSGATAAFLALFSLFLLASPSMFLGTSPAEKLTLPDGTARLANTGRSLMALDETNLQQMLPSEVHKEKLETALELSDYFSQTVEALLLDQADLDLSKHALAVVEDMAQHALALDVDDEDAGADAGRDARPEASKKYLPASTVFPALADRFFESSGLESPQMCRKVFEFSAEDVPAASVSSKKSIEKYVLGTAAGFKGRSSGLKLTPTPHNRNARAVSKAVSPVKTDELMDSIQSIQSAEPAESTSNLPVPSVTEPSLVSVLLPANASVKPSKSGLTAISELYVVILNPQNTFSTYACQLPKRALVI
jgi:hypothetical protein